MTPEQVREVVKITLDELTQRKLLKTVSYQNILKAVEKKLYKYFGSFKDTTGVGRILRALSDDPYIDVIFLHYRDSKTLEWIAEYMERDVSTIKRNKKRLIMTIYELLGGV